MRPPLWLLLLFPNVLFAQRKGIHFEKGLAFKEVLQKAKIQRKFVFVDCYTTWCTPCKEMENDVYNSEKVGEFVNAKFISVQYQMDTTKEDDSNTIRGYADAQNIVKKYRVAAYPCYFFFSPEGNIVHKGVGAMSDSNFIRLTRDALHPERQYYTLMGKYTLGNLDNERTRYIAQYASEIGEGETAKEISQHYINGLKDDELYSKDNLEFIVKFTFSPTDAGFILFGKYADKIDKILGDGTAGNMRYAVLTSQILRSLRTKRGRVDYDKIEKQTISKYGELGRRSIYVALAGYAWETDDVVNFTKYKNKTHATRWKNDISFWSMNNDAWWVFERAADKSSLQSALDWQKKVIAAEAAYPDPGSIDTYANLIYKIGNDKEAIFWEERALKLDREKAALEKRDPDKTFWETLAKMKAGVPTWPVR